MKKFVIFSCVIGMIVLGGCKDKVKPGSVEVQRQAVTDVTVAVISMAQVESFYETSGTVRAKATSIVAPRIMGTVTAMKVKQGDTVKSGDLLLTIDDRDAAHRVSAAEAAYGEARSGLEAAGENRSLARVTHERYSNLFAEKTISRQEMDQFETRKKIAESEYTRAEEVVRRAKAGLDEAKVYHGFTRITAPVTGPVVERKADPGSMAVPGMPLLIIEDSSQLKIEASIDERLSGKIKVGMAAYILIEDTGSRIRGTIGEITPAVDPSSRTFPVKIYVEDRSLRSGMYTKVLIPEGKKDVLLIPKKAVVERGQLAGVFVKDDKGVLTYRLVKTAKLSGDSIEVVSGLKPGESVVVEGVEKAVDGGIVKQ
jgi:RND family efflux transporter MFP subunit